MATLVAAILAIDATPQGHANRAPSAEDAKDAKAVFTRLKESVESGEEERISADWLELSSLALLGGRVAGIDNLAVGRGDRSIEASGSYPLPLGLWLNGAATISADETGAPVISGHVGDLPLPAFVVKGLIAAGRWLLSLKGVDIPRPEEAVRQLQITDAGVSAMVNLKQQAGVFRSLKDLGASSHNSAAVAAEYCRLAKAQTDQPTRSFAETVRRSFSSPHSAADPQATLVALAMITVSTDAGNMAGVEESAIRSCRVDRPRLALLGRTDLAKHWALSAALSTTLGSDVSEALGAWKEIADSGKGGSGFSYVDLAADRAGMLAGARFSASADSAAAARVRLSTATDESLLPVSTLALAEGMSEADYVAQYRNIDSSQHADVVARIDKALKAAGH